ncbi:hypothetical protein KIPB_004121, partial [Kipferlia bialata]
VSVAKKRKSKGKHYQTTYKDMLDMATVSRSSTDTLLVTGHDSGMCHVWKRDDRDTPVSDNECGYRHLRPTQMSMNGTVSWVTNTVEGGVVVCDGRRVRMFTGSGHALATFAPKQRLTCVATDTSSNRMSYLDGLVTLHTVTLDGFRPVGTPIVTHYHRGFSWLCYCAGSPVDADATGVSTLYGYGQNTGLCAVLPESTEPVFKVRDIPAHYNPLGMTPSVNGALITYTEHSAESVVVIAPALQHNMSRSVQLVGHGDKVTCYTSTEFDVSDQTKTQFAVTGSEDGTVRVWSVQSGRCLYCTDRLPQGVRGVSIARTGDIAATLTDGHVHIVHIDGGLEALLEPESARHYAPVIAQTFNADGSLVASLSVDGTVCVFDWKQGTVLNTATLQSKDMGTLLFGFLTEQPRVVLAATSKAHQIGTVSDADRRDYLWDAALVSEDVACSLTSIHLRYEDGNIEMQEPSTSQGAGPVDVPEWQPLVLQGMGIVYEAD